MVVLLRPRTVYLKSNKCALFSVSSRCDFSVSSSPYCTILMSVNFTAELQWSATVLDKLVTLEQFPELGEVPSTISAVTQLCRLVEILDGVKLCSELLDKIVKLWVTLRGFSLCGVWMEAYKVANKKVANKKATQKAKAMRKGLQ